MLKLELQELQQGLKRRVQSLGLILSRIVSTHGHKVEVPIVFLICFCKLIVQFTLIGNYHHGGLADGNLQYLILMPSELSGQCLRI